MKETVQTDREQPKDRKNDYKGPSNNHTNGMAVEGVNIDYRNKFMCIITNQELWGIHIESKLSK